jgi:hypothetical protein
MQGTGAIPTAAEWEWGDDEECPTQFLDYRYARERYLGKSIDQILDIFLENPLAGHVFFAMPAIPLRYYIMVYKRLLLDSTTFAKLMDMGHAADAANAFLGCVRLFLLQRPKAIMPVIEDLLPVMDYVALHQSLLDADLDIYGSFADKVDEIRRLCAQQKGA